MNHTTHRALIPLLLALSGCTNLLHSTAPALQLYMLQPLPMMRVASDPSKPTLRIARPLPGVGYRPHCAAAPRQSPGLLRRQPLERTGDRPGVGPAADRIARRFKLGRGGR
ncbi:MAG: hypothetical protein WDM77_01000 [Steroidobacteraceae bacterium]